ITTAWFTSSWFNQLADTAPRMFEGLRYLLVGGEKVSAPHLRKVKKACPDLKIVNGYGPTENTTFSHCYTLGEEIEENVPIGGPVSGSTSWVLDPYRQPVSIGIRGELYVGGDGLARGYVNNPGLTGEKFVTHPADATQRLYRTGDLARWQADGNLLYAGRADEQVKIRGYRIELGEIENTLKKHPRVSDALVTCLPNPDEGGHTLVAYLVGTGKAEIAEVRAYVSDYLPEQMQPVHYVIMDQFPLTANAKVNKAALPPPVFEADLHGLDRPANKIEAGLAEIWADLLQLPKDQLGVDTTFFALGGHSLKITRMVSRMHARFGRKIPMQLVFQNPTIRALGKLIQNTPWSAYNLLTPAPDQEQYELSSGQKRLYVLQAMDPESAAYNMPEMFALHGRLDKEHLEKVFLQLINRHESLRTRFVLVEGKPYQQIIPVNPDFTVHHSDAPEEHLPGLLENFKQPFDLGKAPLLRVGVASVHEDRHILMIDMHHIISDGLSMKLLIGDFTALYAGQALPALPLRYRDYSEWQRNQEVKQSLRQQEAFWLGDLAGELPVLNLPYDFNRPAVQHFEGASERLSITAEDTASLRRLAAEMNGTLYMVLLACYNILLHKLSAEEDIIVGTPVSGRRHRDLEEIVGLFVNTLPLRNQPRSSKVIRDFLREVKEKCIEAFDHQEYPYEDLVEHTVKLRDMSRNPLFDVMFSYQNANEGPEEGLGKEVRMEPLKGQDYKVAKFDLTLKVREHARYLSFSFEYSTSLFRRETIRQFIGYFRTIIHRVAENSWHTLGSIALLSPEETDQAAALGSGPTVGYPPALVQQRFEDRVREEPGQVALLGEGSRLTYAALNRKSNQLAGLLREKGIGRESIVGLCLDRSAEMVVSILAVLKAGGAYLPIDPNYPPDHKAYLVEDSGAALV
ncbi:MAG: AMP-binding protein, partial [Cytophagales bacterium]|nr:AMP-binding protein [Cytophagales bacterium]